MSAHDVGGPFVNTLRWAWATTDQGYSIAGRSEVLPGGGTSFVVYSVTLTTATANLGQLWRYVVSTASGASAPFAVNTMANTKWRSVALPPFDPDLVILPPSAPAANNSALTVAAGSMVGSPVGGPLGAGLPATPPISWKLLSSTSAGFGNATPFTLGACSGQLYVATPSILVRTTVFALSILAYVDNPAYSPAPSTTVNVTVTVVAAPNTPPVLASPLALNATLPEHPRNGSSLGVPAYADASGRGPSAFAWSIEAPDPSRGAFAFTPGGNLTVSPAGTVSLAYVRGGVNNLTLAVRMTDLTAAASSSVGSVLVVLREVNDPPVLAPPVVQVVAFSEAAGVVGGLTTIGITTADPNGVGSPFYSPTTLALIAPGRVAAVCDPASQPTGGTAAYATTTGSAAGTPLFTVNASSGQLRFAALPSPFTPWASLPSFAYGGVIVRAAWPLCVNASDGGGAWSTGWVSAAVATSTSSASLISGFYLQGPGGAPPLVSPTTGTPVMDTAGGGMVSFTGSGFGAATAPGVAGGAFSATFASVPPASSLRLNYTSPACWVAVADVLLACAYGPGVGGALTWTVVQVATGLPVLAALPLLTAYAAPNVTSLSVGGVEGGLLPTAGGAILTVSGAYFGPATSAGSAAAAGSPISVTFGPTTGDEYACVLLDNSQAQLRCMTNASAGSGLLLRVVVGGQTAAPVDPAALSPLGCMPPTLTRVNTTAGGTQLLLSLLSTLGGDALTLTGTNLGPPSASLSVSLVSPNGLVSLPVPGCTHSLASPHTQLTCLTPPGVGSNLRLTVSVAGLAAASLTAGVPTAGTGVSYAPASVSTVTMPGDSPTMGGATFTISGRGFGPGAAFPGAAIDWALYGANVSTLQVAGGAVSAAQRTGAAVGDATAAAVASAAAAAVLQAAAGGGGGGVYAATDCRTVSDAAASCAMGPGVGRGHFLLLSVGGQIVPPFAAGLAYAPPQVSAISGPGAGGASTASGQAVVLSTGGGEVVTLFGSNLGPGDALTTSQLAVTYATATAAAAGGLGGVGFQLLYSALACNITLPHSRIACLTVVGGGVGLQWSVVLAGQASTDPTTAYAPPVVTSIVWAADGVTPVSGGTAAAAAGGGVIMLRGSSFGPPSSSSRGALVSALSYGRTGGEYSVPLGNVTVLGDGVLTFPVLAGTGAGLTVRVVVAGQANADSPTLSYQPPAVLALFPSHGPTTTSSSTTATSSSGGGASGDGSGSNGASGLVTLAVAGVPFLDATTSCAVLLAGAPLIALSTLRTVAAVAAATNTDGSVNITVLFPSSGVGEGLPVTLSCTQGGAGVVSASTPTAAAAFSYDDPLALSVVAVRPLFNASSAHVAAPAGGYDAAAMSCPFAAGDSSGGWGCTDPTLQLVSVSGLNFGGDGSSGGVIQWLNISWGVGWAAASASGLSSLVSGGFPAPSPPLWRLLWSDTRIQFLTTLSSAAVSVGVNSVDFAGVSHLQSSAALIFTPAAPSIYSVGGAVSNIPTSGGSAAAPLLISAANLGAAAWVSVTVGGADCPLLVLAGGACTQTLVAVSSQYPTMAAAVAAEVLSPSAQQASGGSSAAAAATLLCCVPPPGQGTSVPVSMLVYSTPDATNPPPTVADGAASGMAVGYAPPSLTSVEVFSTSAAATSTSNASSVPLTAPSDSSTVYTSRFTPVVLPTTPVRVRLRGVNLGSAPLLLTGDVAVGAPGSSALGSPCPGTEGASNCFDFSSPPGEGSGRLLLSSGGGGGGEAGNPAYPSSAGYYPLYIQAGNLASPFWSMTYASPRVTAVVPVVAAVPPASVFPTTGGVGVLVLGSGFGATPPLRVSQLSVRVGGTTLQSCSRVNQTAIACVLPPGAGAALNVMVTVADLVGVGPALFSFDAPSISSISVASAGVWDGMAPPNASRGDTSPVATGGTVGGTQLVLMGTNFGPGPGGNASGVPGGASGGYCVFLTWAYRSAVAPPLFCNGLEVSAGNRVE